MAANGIYLERRLIDSEAFNSLSEYQIRGLIQFYLRRKLSKQGRKGHKKWTIDNNGEIVFTFAEAKKRFGWSASSFRRILDGLIEKGFIDIAETGMGVHKVTTLYAISERWRLYGQPHFQQGKRPSRPKGWPGYKRNNKLWKKGQKKITTVSRGHGAVTARGHGEIIAMFSNGHGERIKNIYKFKNNKWIQSQTA